MNTPPVACTLSEGELRCQSAALLPGLAAQAIDARWTPDGIRFRFVASSTQPAAIARTIDLERGCCAFLTFRLDIPDSARPFELTVTGPPGTREFLQQLGLTAATDGTD